LNEARFERKGLALRSKLVLHGAMASTPCTRCGTFFEGAGLCSECLKRLSDGQRYWPAGYLTGVGCLLNPAVASTLLALNYRRMGEAKQARTWAIASGVLIVVYVAIIGLDLPIPGSALWPAGIGGGIAIGRTWQGPWEKLKASGAQRANVWLPVVLTLLFFAGLVLLVALTSPGE
jgi:hypothetical protein